MRVLGTWRRASTPRLAEKPRAATPVLSRVEGLSLNGAPRFYPTGLANRSHLPIIDYFSLARFQRADFGLAPGPYHCSPPAALIPNLLSPKVLFRVG